MNVEFNGLSGILNDFGKEVIVIVMHGRNSSKDRTTSLKLREELSKRNISSLCFDFHGHGKSTGNMETFTIAQAVQDIKDAVNFALSKGFEKYILIGSSFGGTSALRVTTELNPVALALMCPGSRIEKYDERLDLVKKLSTPILIVHGDQDEVVPIEESRRLANTLSNCKLVEIKDADHGFKGHFDEKISSVMEFVEKWI